MEMKGMEILSIAPQPTVLGTVNKQIKNIPYQARDPHKGLITFTKQYILTCMRGPDPPINLYSLELTQCQKSGTSDHGWRPLGKISIQLINSRETEKKRGKRGEISQKSNVYKGHNILDGLIF